MFDSPDSPTAAAAPRPAPWLLASALLALVPVLVLLAVFEVSDAINTLRRTEALRLAADQLVGSASEVEQGQRGYLQSGDPGNLRPILGARDRLPDIEQSLNAVTFESPADLRRAAALVGMVERRVQSAADTVALVAQGRPEEANARFEADRRRGALAAIRRAAGELRSHGQIGLLAGRSARRLGQAAAAGAAAALILVASAAIAWARRSPAVLDRVAGLGQIPAAAEPATSRSGTEHPLTRPDGDPPPRRPIIASEGPPAASTGWALAKKTLGGGG